LSVSPDTIPILIPEKTLNIIQENDTSPFYIIEEIEDIKELANGIEFTPDFWKSYLKVLETRPIPGRKHGHISPYSYETAENDFYTVGGKIKGDKVFLRIYIPPEGFETPNKGFIRDIKAGLVNFSIVSYTRDIIERDEDGWISSVKAIESVRGERNDAVEINLGAMDQKVSKKQNKKEVYLMNNDTYKEIIQNIVNQIDNGKINKNQVAADLKINVVTDEHLSALKDIEEIKKLCGDNYKAAIADMIKNQENVKKENFKNIREKAMSEKFGPVKINVNGKEEDNLKRIAADSMVTKEIVTEEELKKQIEIANENPAVKKLSFDSVDVNSDVNLISVTGSDNTNDKTVRKTEHIEI
jgi:hypothetical protein